jgi:hypothetical protein
MLSVLINVIEVNNCERKAFLRNIGNYVGVFADD